MNSAHIRQLYFNLAWNKSLLIQVGVSAEQTIAALIIVHHANDAFANSRAVTESCDSTFQPRKASASTEGCVACPLEGAREHTDRWPEGPNMR